MMLAKLGEITLKLDRDVKKDDKVSLNDILSYDERNKRELTAASEAKKGSQVKITVETV